MTRSDVIVPGVCERAGFPRSTSLARIPLAILALCGGLAGGLAQAAPAPNQLPTGGQVRAGQASLASRGSTLSVNQASTRAVIDWQSFNLGSQATVIFNQAAGRNAATLNRVLSGAPSEILGRIQAPGQVFITNPSGVIFGKSASVNVGGLAATTMGITNDDFMRGGVLDWQRNGSTGGVLNLGQLSADGGIVALMAPEVRNEGVISARAGAVLLAGGEAIQLDFADTSLASVQITPAQLRTLVENRHAILAQDGTVLLAARSALALQSGVINQSGVIDASSLVNRGGRVMLEADQISLSATSSINASGAQGGGTVLVGGDWQGSGATAQAHSVDMAAGAQIKADATQGGTGGRIVLWSDTSDAAGSTQVAGYLSAQGPAGGGQIETSGHRVAVGGATVNAGRGGLWLTDPADITIDASTASTYNSTLAAGSNVTVTTSGGGAGNGDITLAAAISWTTPATLQLNAQGDIWLRDTLTATQGTLNLRYGQVGVSAGNTADYHVLAPVTLGATAHFVTRRGSNGSDTNWTVITALGAATDTNGLSLQGMGGGLAGNYVLGADIDASATSSWNSGSGFAPIGANSGSSFTGRLEGLGHVISNLTINRPSTTFVGLFGVAGSSSDLRNIGLRNAAITSSVGAGALAGSLGGLASGIWASGSVTATACQASACNATVGGLVGTLASGTIRNSYAAVDVDGGTLGRRAGGLVGAVSTSGATATVDASVAAGNVYGALGTTGGLVGAILSGTVTNSRSSSVVNGVIGTALNVIGSDPGTPYSTVTNVGYASASTTQSNYTNSLDFTNAWTMYDGHSRPLLRAFLRPLVVAAPGSKVYDGTNTGTASYSIAGATPQGTLVYQGAGSNVGTYTSLSLSGLYSTDQQGWNISYQPVGSLSITPRALTISGLSASDKVYDGTAVASLTGSAVLGNKVAGDNLGVDPNGSLFSDKNVGTGKTVSLALTGSAASNYSAPTLSASITPLALTVSGLSASDKAYDGTSAATVTGSPSLTNAIAGDSLSAALGASSFADKNAGTGKTVTTALSLSGADAGNYTLAPQSLSATITPLALTVGGLTASDKTYDGTTAATITGTATLTSPIAGDQVTVAAGASSFADKQVGTGKTVTATLTLSGSDAGNYTLAPNSLSANITPLALTVSGLSASDKA